MADQDQVTSLRKTIAELKQKITELEKDSAELSALEQAGVDNWEGYDEAMAILRGEDPY